MEKEKKILTLSDFLFCPYEKIFDIHNNVACIKPSLFATAISYNTGNGILCCFSTKQRPYSR